MRFYQDGYVERSDFGVLQSFIFEPVWFHFLKNLKLNAKIRSI